jgi:hypothetical protein
VIPVIVQKRAILHMVNCSRGNLGE